LSIGSKPTLITGTSKIGRYPRIAMYSKTKLLGLTPLQLGPPAGKICVWSQSGTSATSAKSNCSPITWTLVPPLSAPFTGKDGKSNCSSKPLSRISRSRLSLAPALTRCGFRFGQHYKVPSQLRIAQQMLSSSLTDRRPGSCTFHNRPFPINLPLGTGQMFRLSLNQSFPRPAVNLPCEDS
jgi:hypothetical protein